MVNKKNPDVYKTYALFLMLLFFFFYCESKTWNFFLVFKINF